MPMMNMVAWAWVVRPKRKRLHFNLLAAMRQLRIRRMEKVLHPAGLFRRQR
jgi:hypothetical protein